MVWRNGKSWLDLVGYASAVMAGVAALAHNADLVVVRIRELVADARGRAQDRPIDKRK